MSIELQENHFVFCPKYRKPIFQDQKVRQQCEAIFRFIAERRGWQIKALSIMPDHLHLLLARPRTISEAQVAQQLKGASSRELRKNFPYLKGVSTYAFWARNYHVDSVGLSNDETIQHYIERQERAWLREHGKPAFVQAQPVKIKPVPQRRLP